MTALLLLAEKIMQKTDGQLYLQHIIVIKDIRRVRKLQLKQTLTVSLCLMMIFVGRDNGIVDENAPVNWSYEFSGNINYCVKMPMEGFAASTLVVLRRVFRQTYHFG